MPRRVTNRTGSRVVAPHAHAGEWPASGLNGERNLYVKLSVIISLEAVNGSQVVVVVIEGCKDVQTGR